MSQQAELNGRTQKCDLVTKTYLDAKLEAAKTEILKWMFGQTLVLIGVLMALLRFGH